MSRRSPVDEWVAGRLGIALDALTPEALAEYQLAAFRHTLAYAKARSSFYGELYAGVAPESIRTMADVAALPTTAEDDLAGNEWRFYCVKPQEAARVVTVPTTGTHGRVKSLAFTAQDIMSAVEFMTAGSHTMCAEDSRMLVLMSGDTAGGAGDTIRRSLTPAGIETRVGGTVGDIAAAYRALREFAPDTLIAFPFQALALALYGRRFGNPERAHIKAVILSADQIPPALKRRIAALWGCKVYAHYGMTELCMAGGVECDGQAGYHTRDCDVLYEIIERDERGRGELVITTLNRAAMPLIRYRTGDIARFDNAPCPCGSPLARIERVYGRLSNTARLAGGDLVLLGDVADAALADENVADFECRAEENTLLVELKTLAGERADEALVRRALGRLAPNAELNVRQREFFSFEDGAAKKILRRDI